jgi:Flp pilus assembly protein CpaB
VAPVVLAVLAAVLVLAGLRDRSATTVEPVASRSIPAGAAIDSGDTRLVKVHRSDSGLRSGLISPGVLGSGLVAATPIQAGDPITRSVSAHGTAGGSGLGSMSIPVPVDRADGGAIVTGDRVDVITSSGGSASYLGQGLLVLSVSSSKAGGVLGAASSDFWVTVAVDRSTALRLAAALGSSTSGTAGTVEVVRSTGETGSTPQTSYSPLTTSGAGR